MRTFDYFVVALYLVGVFAVGVAFRGRKQNADEFFTGHGSFHGALGSALIGLSIAASFFSGISFIVYSSFAYSTGVQILAGIVAIPIAWALLRYWFLKRYWAAHNRHPYDVVETRFGYWVRGCLSVMFVLYRIGWMAVIIYAPTLILMGALGLSRAWFWPVVLLIGGTCTALSIVGGIRALIVIDAMQFLIIALGLALTIGLILFRMHGNTSGIWSDLRATGRLHLLDFSFSWSSSWSIWTVVIGSAVSNVGMYVSDQMALQRYLASESLAAVSRSFLINLYGVLAVALLLVSVGLLLSVWYLHHPDPGLPTNADQVLPYFAARQLPPGMSGILIAAILAATTNALTSGINSLAGSIINDFISRLGRRRSPAELFHLARPICLVLGVIATVSAGFARKLGSVLDACNVMQGAFQGPMLACVLWAVSGARVRPWPLLIGMILGGAAGWGVALTPASSFWVAPAGTVFPILIPWIDLWLVQRRAATPKS